MGADYDAEVLGWWYHVHLCSTSLFDIGFALMNQNDTSDVIYRLVADAILKHTKPATESPRFPIYID